MPVWSEVSQSYWDIPDYSDYNSWLPTQEDALYMIGIAIGLTLLRVQVQNHYAREAKTQGVKKCRKYAESMWKSLIYFSNVAWGLKIVMECDWFPTTSNCYKGFPDIERSHEMKMYMLWQLGFYLHSLYCHFFIEISRSDYWPLLAHHIATLFLVYSAYVIRYERIGLLVLCSHDINDLFLEIGKTFVYREKKTMTNIWFGVIIVSWVALRLVLFPFVIIRSTIFESIEHIPIDIFPFYYSLNASLLFLVVLHVYWFGLMIRMLVRVLSGQEKGVVDSREQKGLNGVEGKQPGSPVTTSKSAPAN